MKSSSAMSAAIAPCPSASRDLLKQLQPEPDARQRRAQFMRSVGEQQPVRTDELLDTCRGAIEALRQPRHLIAAFDLGARGEIASAERIDRRLQPLDPPRQPAHHRKGGERDRERDRAKKQHHAERGMAARNMRTHEQPTLVGHLDSPDRAGRPGHPARAVAAARRPDRTSDTGDRPIVATEQRQIRIDAPREMTQAFPR